MLSSSIVSLAASYVLFVLFKMGHNMNRSSAINAENIQLFIE